MQDPSNPQAGPARTESGEYVVPSLEGVHGRIEFVAPDRRVHVEIDDGKVRVLPPDGKADTVVASDIPGELLRLISGEIHLVTALLQGRVDAEGDPLLLVKIAGAMPELGRQQPVNVVGG